MPRQDGSLIGLAVLIVCVTNAQDLISKLSDCTVDVDNNCAALCNCKVRDERCELTQGFCTSGCLDGWLGPACQYRTADILQPSWAADGDRSACSGQNRSTSEGMDTKLELTVQLVRPVRLTWLLVAFVDDHVAENMTIRYTSLTGTGSCPPQRTLSRPLTQTADYEVYCPVDDLVVSLTLKADGPAPFCFVAINRGILLNSLDHETDKQCTKALHLPPYTWKLTLDESYTVNEIALILREAGLGAVKTINVAVFAPNCSTVYSRLLSTDVSGSEETSLHVVLAPPVGEQAHIVAISPMAGSNYWLASFYDLEIYGDCPHGRYGIGCRDTCLCYPDSRCSATGQCIGHCYPGFVGHNCSTPCAPGHFGLECANECSQCPSKNCNPMTGDCNWHRTTSTLLPDLDANFTNAAVSQRPSAKMALRKLLSSIKGYILHSGAIPVLVVSSAFLLTAVAHLALTARDKHVARPTRPTLPTLAPTHLVSTRSSLWGSNICDDGGDGGDMQSVSTPDDFVFYDIESDDDLSVEVIRPELSLALAGESRV